MEAAAVLRSFRGGVRTKQPSESFLEKPAVAHVSTVALKAKPFSEVFMVTQGWKRSFLPYLKASETNSALTSEVTSDRSSQEPLEKTSMQNSVFPNGFEALVLEVCDETNIAEFKIKIGDFEMHLKRDIESPRAPSPGTHIVSPTTAPPIPSEPMNESGAAAQPVVSQKSPPAVTSPFANISSAKASKLAALEASVSNAYVLVSSPTVGTFQRAGTFKGKKQPPSCKEGDIIKEGQIIGFLDQFGNELPVKSDVAGEILKVLCQDGGCTHMHMPVHVRAERERVCLLELLPLLLLCYHSSYATLQTDSSSPLVDYRTSLPL